MSGRPPEAQINLLLLLVMVVVVTLSDVVVVVLLVVLMVGSSVGVVVVVEVTCFVSVGKDGWPTCVCCAAGWREHLHCHSHWHGLLLATLALKH
jgi:hypothetical protein